MGFPRREMIVPDLPIEKVARIAREAEGYYELGLHEEALERLEQISEHPTVGKAARAMRAECLRCLERWEEGASAFEDVIREDRENVTAYVGLGWCRKRSGRLDLARDAMERLLAVRPEEAIGLYNLACYCSLAGEREQAIRLLSRAIEEEEQFREHALEEPDLDPIREDPDFRRIVP
jgi:Flp pilus assembly protein TadD